jgi:hypothetical protein
MNLTRSTVQPTLQSQKGGWLGFLVWTAGILVLLVLVLTVACVIIIDSAGAEALSGYLTQKTGFAVSYESCKMDALAGRVEATGLKIDNPKELGGGNFLTAEQLVFQMDLLSLGGPQPHIRELTLHLSQISDVRTPKGDNAQVFYQRLMGSKDGGKKIGSAPAPTSGDSRPAKLLIDHLKLQVDRVNLVDATLGEPQTSSYELNFKFERSNVTDAEGLKRELVADFMRQGFLSGGRNFIKMTRGLTGGLLDTGTGSVDGALKGALKGIKSILDE